MVHHHLDGRKKTRRYYYNCPNHTSTNSISKCTTKPINADYIENYVLDVVVSIINSNNLSRELALKQKELISYYNGIVSKNKQILSEKTKTFDNLVNSIATTKNQTLINQYQKRLEALGLEMEIYENKIIEQELIINNLKTKSVSPIISKEELLVDRKVAQSIIKEVISLIEVDESTGEITIQIH